MAETFKFELVSPERVLLSVDAEQTVVPGAEGEFTMLPGHSPLVTTLRPGVLDVTAGGTHKRLFVKSGFCEVTPERLTVLAESAFDVDDLKGAVLSREIEAAEAALAKTKTDEARMHAETLVSELRRLN